MRAITLLLALLCAGVDCLVTLASRERRHHITQHGFGLDTPEMRVAFARVRARPWSVLHEWVNLAVAYYEGPAQEGPVKLTGAVVVTLLVIILMMGWL